MLKGLKRRKKGALIVDRLIDTKYDFDDHNPR